MCDLAGLVIYILLLTTAVAAVLLSNRFRAVSLALFLLIALVAAFRGHAGVDTPLYIARFEHIGLMPIPFIEPLIPALMKLIRWIGGSFAAFSLLLGVLIGLNYWFIFQRYPNAIYFGITMFPVIYIDSLFNGIRIGLSYPIIMTAIASNSVILILLAAMGHISSFIALPFIGKYNYRHLAVVVGLILIVTIEFDFFRNLPFRYLSKLNVYSTLPARNWYGGIADSAALLMAFVTWLFAAKFPQKTIVRYSAIATILIVILEIALINQYAFMLRVIRLLAIAIYGVILTKEKISDRLVLCVSVVFGIFYLLNFIRQIMVSCAYENGFLPLTF